MSKDSAPPTLVVIVGPPAVGKMTVGNETRATQPERLRRNELVLRFFDFGTPPFHRLVGEFRRRLFEEVATSTEKPSKRDLAASRKRLLAEDAKYQLNSQGAFDDRADYLRLETTAMEASDVAERIIAYFALPRSDSHSPPA